MSSTTKTPAKKPAAKKPTKPIAPDHFEDIQAPYKFKPDEIDAMNHGLRSALDDIETLQDQLKAASQDFKLRIQNRKNDTKQLRNKLGAGEETRPMKAIVEFLPKSSKKRYLHPETRELVREEPMQPADWQLPLFKTEEVKKPTPPASTTPPAPATEEKKPGKPTKTSPVGKTSVGDALDKAAAKEKAPQFWIDLDKGDWNEKGLTQEFRKAAKSAGWSNPQISALADQLKAADGVDKLIDTLRPFVISPDDYFIEVSGPESLNSVKVPRLDVTIPDGFPLEKVIQTFRTAAVRAKWPAKAINAVASEAERQARVIGDEPEATEAAANHLRGFTVNK